MARSTLIGRLRRARIAVAGALVLVTGGLTAAVAGAIPGREVAKPSAPDPFSEPLTAFPPTTGAPGPAATSAAPIAVSGAS